jgi:N-glycosidase YbiA
MIDKFEGTYRFLSNFWPCEVQFEGETYPSVEHAYQAAKTDDEEQRANIRLAPDAKTAKRLGKKVTMREDWDDVRLQVMASLLAQKFAQGSELANQLLATKNQQLVEGNWWGDTFWGVCKGKGENHLGELLMKQRRNLSLPRSS